MQETLHLLEIWVFDDQALLSMHKLLVEAVEKRISWLVSKSLSEQSEM